MTDLRAQTLRKQSHLVAGVAALVIAASLLATLPIRITVLSATGIAFLLFAVRRPWLSWLALGFSLPFAAAERLGAASALDFLLIFAIVLWAADGIRCGVWRLEWHGPAIVALIYASVLALSALRAQDLGQAATEVIKWIEFAAVLLVLPQMVVRASVRWIVAAIAAGATAQALLGIYQFVNGIGPEWFIVLGRFMRASGTFAQPNPFAGYLVVTLPVLLSVTLAEWGRLVAGGRAGHRWAWALGLSGATLAVGMGILASWSRGGWLAAGVGVVVVLFLRSRRSVALGSVLLLAVFAGALLTSLSWRALPEPVAARFTSIPAFFGGGGVLQQEVNDDNFAVVERVAHWAAAVRMLERETLLGVGAGNYETAYPNYRLPAWEEPLGHAHNAYLNVLAESGVTGFAAFALLWVAAIVRLLRLRRSSARTGDGYGAALVLGTLGVLAALAVHSMVDVLFVQGIYMQIALWLALSDARVEPAAFVREAPQDGLGPMAVTAR